MSRGIRNNTNIDLANDIARQIHLVDHFAAEGAVLEAGKSPVDGTNDVQAITEFNEAEIVRQNALHTGLGSDPLVSGGLKELGKAKTAHAAWHGISTLWSVKLTPSWGNASGPTSFTVAPSIDKSKTGIEATGLMDTSAITSRYEMDGHYFFLDSIGVHGKALDETLLPVAKRNVAILERALAENNLVVLKEERREEDQQLYAITGQVQTNDGEEMTVEIMRYQEEGFEVTFQKEDQPEIYLMVSNNPLLDSVKGALADFFDGVKDCNDIDVL